MDPEREDYHDLRAIREGLERLWGTPSPPVGRVTPRGHWDLNPVLSEEQVRAFEKRHRIKLPADYRGFVTTLGNGGAGPAGEVFPLGEIIWGGKQPALAAGEGARSRRPSGQAIPLHRGMERPQLPVVGAPA